MALQLQKVRESKNGIVSYKADNQRSTGIVYFNRKMFPNGAPDTLTIEAEGIAHPQPRPAKTEATPVSQPAEEVGAEA